MIKNIKDANMLHSIHRIICRVFGHKWKERSSDKNLRETCFMLCQKHKSWDFCENRCGIKMGNNPLNQ